ncbi:MAG: hypothetical protein M3O15_08460, partial [Acidobacteriota bacterium]|nr:hypothetical protein [Acidobacteriota bacterium]
VEVTPSTRASAFDFYPVQPCRLLDTRSADSPTGGAPLASGPPLVLSLAGACGVPTTARALALNITVTAPTAEGHLSLFAADRPTTTTSTINFAAGQTRANNAIVALSSGVPFGEVKVAAGVAGSVHVIVDVSGYFQ